MGKSREVAELGSTLTVDGAFVGVNTPTPDQPLDVEGTYATLGVTGSGYALFNFGKSATPANNWHIGSENNGFFHFYNGDIGSGNSAVAFANTGAIYCKGVDADGDTNASFMATGNTGVGEYNYVLSASNGTGSSVVLFSNHATRSADGGGNTTTLRNDIGMLRLGTSVHYTEIEGSRVRISNWGQNCYLDRAWDGYPSITIGNDIPNVGEFRIHGYPGGIGGDFSIVTRSDGGFVTGSDARKKTNVEDITDALSIVSQLEGKTFNVVNTDLEVQTHLSSEATGKKYGFIAQDAIKIVPEAVKFYEEADTPLENGYASAYSMDYASLVPLLTEAIKQLVEANNTLEARIEALENA